MKQNNKLWQSRKIIHVDMDSFFASIEIRDKPSLRNKPVAVAGKANERGVLTTCNYIARKFGLHSAMPTKRAVQLCKNLVIVPVDIEKYKKESSEIFKVFKCYSKKIEPVSIDEAYIDVTDSYYCSGNPEIMASQIRSCIKKDFGITASAGISTNKLISKICSDWKKPDNQFSVCDNQISSFIKDVSLKKIPGIGKVNFEKCKNLNMSICKDMYSYTSDDLTELFGSYGKILYNLIRGIDNRELETNRVRKSISVEDTFIRDIESIELCKMNLAELYKKLISRCENLEVPIGQIKDIFIKIKFNNFETITRQVKCNSLNLNKYIELFDMNINELTRPIRLLGLGFTLKQDNMDVVQFDIFDS